LANLLSKQKQGSIKPNEPHCFKLFVKLSLFVSFFAEEEIPIQQEKAFIGFLWRKISTKSRAPASQIIPARALRGP